MNGVSGFMFSMKLSEIVYVYLYLYYLNTFCNCEDNLHYLQYIPEDEIGWVEGVLSVTHSNNHAGLLLLGGITDPEVMGRTVPSVKAASLLFYDGINFIFFFFKINLLFSGTQCFLDIPIDEPVAAGRFIN